MLSQIECDSNLPNIVSLLFLALLGSRMLHALKRTLFGRFGDDSRHNHIFMLKGIFSSRTCLHNPITYSISQVGGSGWWRL